MPRRLRSLSRRGARPTVRAAWAGPASGYPAAAAAGITGSDRPAAPELKAPLNRLLIVALTQAASSTGTSAPA